MGASKCPHQRGLKQTKSIKVRKGSPAEEMANYLSQQGKNDKSTTDNAREFIKAFTWPKSHMDSQKPNSADSLQEKPRYYSTEKHSSDYNKRIWLFRIVFEQKKHVTRFRAGFRKKDKYLMVNTKL